MDTEIAEFRRLVSTLDRPYRASPYPPELRNLADAGVVANPTRTSQASAVVRFM